MEYIQISMLRPDMERVPRHPLPEGFTMRTYRQGDKATWVRIWREAEPFIKDISPATFDREFGHDLPAMPKRCYFLVAPDGRDAGTASAWYDRRYAGKRWGVLHWVAVVPDFQGMGLAKPMVAFAMDRLRSLGHRRALLRTQTPRLGAIKVYLDFGFLPEIGSQEALRAWSLVRDALPHPVLAEALKAQTRRQRSVADEPTDE